MTNSLKIKLCCIVGAVFASVSAYAIPDRVSCEVKPVYGYRADGSPGRVIAVSMYGDKLEGKVWVDVRYRGKKETSCFEINASDSTVLEVLLPSSVPVDKRSDVVVAVRNDKLILKKKLTVNPMRHWTVYLYNHAHVDIGYTNTHKNIERLHKSNVREGIKLSRETAGLTNGARYVWNPEVTWPVERLWMSEPEWRKDIVEAIKDGGLAIDASYLNLNTSICSDEELFHVFRFSRELQRLSGVPADVFQQFDIPGISWGLIPVMAQEGVKYIISWPNKDRAGLAHAYGMDGKPFWWLGPDGKSKVLFLQPGQYANSGSMDKGAETGRPWFGQRDPRKVPARIQTGSANVDFTKKLSELEKEGYPYDMYVMSWSLWDNNPIDADVPYAVDEWNRKYAYPKIIISGGHEIMSAFEEKYGDTFPVVSGDYTEYWTDGVGTAADLTAMNRRSKERLTQAETVWSMVSDGYAAPRSEFDDGWRNILMGSEHTWVYENPKEPYFPEAIMKVKRSYFHTAEDMSQSLMDEALGLIADKSEGGFGPEEGMADGGVAVLNTQAWPHGGLIILSPEESVKGDRVVDENGNAVPSQRLSTGELAFMADMVPALGSRHYRVIQGEALKADACRIDARSMENGVIKLRIDENTGNIVALTRDGEEYNYVEKEGANTCCWLPANVDKPEWGRVTSISVIEDGGLVAELLVESEMTGCRSVSRSVRLVAGQPWVEITNIVDKLPLMEKDGIHFGFNFHAENSHTMVDIPWGIMEVEKDQWRQANRNWFAVQRWLDVSDEDHGVTWCSLDAPLFEYGGRYANIALGWGEQGPWEKSLPQSSSIYSWVMNNHWHTNFPLTQDGPVSFRYRMYPHSHGFNPAEANRFGLEQAQPLLHILADRNPEIRPLLEIDNPNVFVTILKPTANEGEIVVRLRSISDTDEQVNLSFPERKPQSVKLCRIEENAAESVDGPLVLPPYGLVTLKLQYIY